MKRPIESGRLEIAIGSLGWSRAPQANAGHGWAA